MEEYHRLLDAEPKRSKYGNKRVRFDGFTFDSKAELARYKELKLRLRAVKGAICMLKVHPSWPFYVGNEHQFDYIADFSYLTLPEYELVVEDVKGERTGEYKLKKKLIEAYHKIKITEIEAYPHKRRKRTNVRKEESRHARTQRRVQGARAAASSAAADRLP